MSAAVCHLPTAAVSLPLFCARRRDGGFDTDSGKLSQNGSNLPPLVETRRTSPPRGRSTQLLVAPPDACEEAVLLLRRRHA